MIRILSIFFIILITNIFQARSQWTIDLETGLAFQSYNDVRIPNQGATLFDFTKEFNPEGPVIPFRARVGYTIAEKNHIILLYAPLSIDYEGTPSKDIRFAENVLEQGVPTNGYYQFNSYRITYRRDFIRSDKWIFGAGFTAKIRDASVRLANNEGIKGRKDNTGFVPLLHLFTEYQFSDYSIYFEGDGLAGGPGRAFDLFLGGRVLLTEKLSGKIGYRLLEGGADVDEVYNFTLVNYGILGLIMQF
ncbi:hypothetical protein C9994_03825 [Marivirga lumbricoides]|uniref:Outer membrane protein beta-barrel domain-containing protein n=1 Tax=Marivirga lumbricoides TaxID=1046115 RepID=A0A2T4DTT9_9BACT|nr:hypothetical protein C9994_03825 [Marivirga lumbricoides]